MHNLKYDKPNYEKTLEEQLKLLQQVVANVNASENTQEQIIQIERELISVNNEKPAGIILRSKVQWIQVWRTKRFFFVKSCKKKLNKSE